jgi:hypothetical protein
VAVLSTYYDTPSNSKQTMASEKCRLVWVVTSGRFALLILSRRHDIPIDVPVVSQVMGHVQCRPRHKGCECACDKSSDRRTICRRAYTSPNASVVQDNGHISASCNSSSHPPQISQRVLFQGPSPLQGRAANPEFFVLCKGEQ